MNFQWYWGDMDRQFYSLCKCNLRHFWHTIADRQKKHQFDTSVKYLVSGFMIVCGMSSCSSQSQCSYKVVTWGSKKKEKTFHTNHTTELINWIRHHFIQGLITLEKPSAKFHDNILKATLFKCVLKMVDFTCVPAQEGGDGSFLSWPPMIHQLSTQSQCWCDRLEMVSHQNPWSEKWKRFHYTYSRIAHHE